MSTFAEYLAAALVQTAKDLAGISCARDELPDLIRAMWAVRVSDEELGAALRILNRCDIAYSEADSFAGDFVVINEARFAAFMSRVAADRKIYDDTISSALDDNLGISRAESLSLRALDTYNRFEVIRKYSAFGEEWIKRAMAKHAEQRDRLGQGGEIPASDRVVRLDDNSPKILAVQESIAELGQWIRKGNDLGDMSPDQAIAVAAEVDQLGIALKEDYVRPSTLIDRARKTLNWVAEKAAGTLVGKAALALLAAILALFGVDI